MSESHCVSVWPAAFPSQQQLYTLMRFHFLTMILQKFDWSISKSHPVFAVVTKGQVCPDHRPEYYLLLSQSKKLHFSNQAKIDSNASISIYDEGIPGISSALSKSSREKRNKLKTLHAQLCQARSMPYCTIYILFSYWEKYHASSGSKMHDLSLGYMWSFGALMACRRAQLEMQARLVNRLAFRRSLCPWIWSDSAETALVVSHSCRLISLCPFSEERTGHSAR